MTNASMFAPVRRTGRIRSGPRPGSRGVGRAIAIACCALATAVALAGCEGSNALSSNAAPETAVAPPPKLKSVAVYPVLAAPAPLNKQIQDGVADAIDKSKFRVVTVADGSTPPSDYQLRGYGTASKDKTGAKFAYFFDVLDAQGQKLNRIAGEEPLGKVPAKTKDLWPSVTGDIVKSAAAKTAASFATTVAGAPTAPVPAAPSSATPTAGAASTPAPIQAAASQDSPPVTQAVASPAGPSTVAVLPVTGAPGDGDKSLTAALKTELKRKGFTVVDASAPAAFKVHGLVTATPTETGQEQVKIAWDVKDGSGSRIATVSQGNTVEKGALSGAWGATAGDVAAAASVAILPLLKKDGAPAPVPGKQASAAGTVR
ncbi:MAG: hypothetical protein K2Y05_12685 [Hyphomicrobiaceae bacterium]|nr:hypothetical protein [Hyphomicrobiaceae bacterium]